MGMTASTAGTFGNSRTPAAAMAHRLFTPERQAVPAEVLDAALGLAPAESYGDKPLSFWRLGDLAFASVVASTHPLASKPARSNFRS